MSKLEQDIKSKDKVLIKLQISKGEIKDTILSKDKINEDLKLQVARL